MDKSISGKVVHTFDPVFDMNSRILILGTMPSVKSREANFYYMNPHNLFWKLVSEIFNWPFPQTVEDKREMLLANRIALWDVLKSCDIKGSLDSTIKSPVPNNFSEIFKAAEIKAVFTNGGKATSLYKSYCAKVTGMESIYLPSTSPANKTFSYDRIQEEWKKILPYLQ